MVHFLICNNNDKLKLKIWSSSQSVLGWSCFGVQYFQAKEGIRLKYHWDQSIPRAGMFLGPKYAWGQSGLGTKLALSRDNLVHMVLIGLTKEVLKFKTFLG